MSDDVKKAEFLSFVIESYKMKLGAVSGLKVADFLEEYGVLDFLLTHYNLLHTLGKEQLLDEIERYLKKRGASC